MKDTYPAAVERLRRSQQGETMKPDLTNLDTTDFPKRGCRQCGKTDRPQFEGVCNDDICSHRCVTMGARSERPNADRLRIVSPKGFVICVINAAAAFDELFVQRHIADAVSDERNEGYELRISQLETKWVDSLDTIQKMLEEAGIDFTDKGVALNGPKPIDTIRAVVKERDAAWSACRGADVETNRLRAKVDHSHEWYAVRWERLRDLLKGTELDREACCIMANGVAGANDPPTYAQLLNTKQHELDKYRADAKAAAGELLVTIPEPGTDAAKLLSANSLMRRENEELRSEVRRLSEPPKSFPAIVHAVVQLMETEDGKRVVRMMHTYEMEIAKLRVLLASAIDDLNEWVELAEDQRSGGATGRIASQVAIDETGAIIERLKEGTNG